MYKGNYFQIVLFAILAVVSSNMVFGNQLNYIDLSNQKQCELPDFPDYGQTFNVTFADNSTLNFASEAPHIPDDKLMVEFCRSGWWVSYDDFNYKTWYGDRFGQRIHFAPGSSGHPMSPSCDTPSEYFHTRQIRSARGIGYEDNSPSATFFSEIYYGGERTVYKNGTEIPVLPYEVNGFAALNVGVLFFEEENFEGASIYNPGARCRVIKCNGEIIYYLCFNGDVPGSPHGMPFIPKSAKLVNERQ